jgi:hypothetical protein
VKKDPKQLPAAKMANHFVLAAIKNITPYTKFASDANS